MAKRITKKELSEQNYKYLQKSREADNKIYALEQEVKKSRQENADLYESNNTLSKRNEILTGRVQEIIIHHDILLRASLRKEGMSWEDINRLINDSRSNFNGMGGATTMGRGY